MSAEDTSAPKISIGRDVNGQVVVGNGNLIHTSPERTNGPPALHQQNTVKGHGTAYSAAHGDIHIHHPGGAGENDASDQSETS